MGSYQVIKTLGQWLAFPPKLAKYIGIEETIFLLNLIYRLSEEEEWIERSSEKLEQETSLTYKQQARVRRRLKGLGLLEMRTHRPTHRTFYRVVEGKFDAVLLTLKTKTALVNLPKVNSSIDERAVRELTKGQFVLSSKEEVQEEKKKKETLLPDWLPIESWKEYLEMRSKIHAPMSEGAKKRAIRKLDSLRAQGHDVEKMFDEAILKCWKSFYAPHLEGEVTNGRESWDQQRERRNAEAARQFLERHSH